MAAGVNSLSIWSQWLSGYLASLGRNCSRVNSDFPGSQSALCSSQECRSPHHHPKNRKTQPQALITTSVDEMMSCPTCKIILGAQIVRHLQIGCKCLCEFCEGQEIEHNDKWSSEPHCHWKAVGIQELKCVMCNSDKFLGISVFISPLEGVVDTKLPSFL